MTGRGILYPPSFYRYFSITTGIFRLGLKEIIGNGCIGLLLFIASLNRAASAPRASCISSIAKWPAKQVLLPGRKGR